MKSIILSLAVLSSLLATLVLQSQTPTEDFDPLGEVADADLPKMIRVHAEFIEMPQATYTELLSKPSTSANDTQLRAECAELIAGGEARLVESMSVTAIPGQAATVESIAEYIYPTEYDPGEVPQEVNGIPPGPDAMALGSPPNPTAFDIKNTGSTLEVEAQIDVNETFIELRFTPTIVYFVDNLNYGADEHRGAAGPILMPQFYVLSVRTGASLINGQPTMVAAHSPKNEEGFTDSSRKIMLFMRADLLTVGK